MAGARRIEIYPTRLAVMLMFAGAPAALLLAVIAPDAWPAGAAWIVLVGAAILADERMAASPADLSLAVAAPERISIGSAAEARVSLSFRRRAPATAQAALQAGDKLAVSGAGKSTIRDGEGLIRFDLKPLRRGRSDIEGAWARWRGPWGLVWKQLVQDLDIAIAVTPDIGGVKQEAVRLFSRQAPHGLKTQLDTGEGSEFHALQEFQPGMDPRTIDWKQSARHSQLLAKEYRTERNNPIVLAIDAGRSMCEPVAGAPRLDVALNASLLLAYVSLKMGDRAGLYSFDIRPGRMSRPVVGVRAFPTLQKAAAAIDYSSEETNYTLGLSHLADRLERRSMVVVFTEFADPTSAETMVETVGRLLGKHLVVFVVMRDEELEEMMRAEPTAPADVSRAAIAFSLHQERAKVLARLRRLGVEIIDAPAARVGAELLDRYLDLKRRNRF